jgi:hypothetical protein
MCFSSTLTYLNIISILLDLNISNPFFSTSFGSKRDPQQFISLDDSRGNQKGFFTKAFSLERKTNKFILWLCLVTFLGVVFVF